VFIVAIIAGVVLHKRRQKAAALTAGVQVQIATTPAGASVRIDGDPKCTSACSVSLAPGNYQITAFLEGYEPAASGIAVTPGQPVSENLILEPQAQSLRILTDLDQGKVAVDDQPAVDLQDGQYILDRVLPGTHTVKITGKNAEASFSFAIADAKPPSITGPVTARNLNAVLVASLGNQAHVVTNSGPLKLAVNGQAEEDTGPAGVDLKTFQSGLDELVIGDGKDQVSVKESFGPAPMLTAFLRSGASTGTLIVSTGEDDVRVFINNRDVGRRTQRGQVRVQTLGPVSVRVSKDGFDAPPVQTAEVKKGAETRLEFKLKAAAQFSTIQVIGGTPGAEVLIDQRSLGIVGPDGGFTSGGVAPGDHVIELRRDQYGTRRLTRTFRAGLTTTVIGADAILAANPTPVPAPPPPKPEPAPTPAPVIASKEIAPASTSGGMGDWEDPAAWKQEGGEWLHRGKGFVPYKLPPKGVFTFTVQLVKGGGLLRGGKISWAFEYLDAKNYALYEMDNKYFDAKVVSKGKTAERTHTQLKDLAKQKSFTIQIEVSPERVVHKMFSGGEWVTLDTWAEVGRNFSEGKFGFLLLGNDEIGLSDFKFQPK
jgi:PEGA domain-containing protein